MMRPIVAAAILTALLGPVAASAQQRPAAADCQRLPGGSAPIQRIAALKTPLAVRNLELIYFGKRLADLTSKDFEDLAQLYPACNPQDQSAAGTVERFRDIVLAAQTERKETANWIEKVKFEAGGLPATRDGIVRITVMWYEMEQKSPDLMPADAEDLAKFLAARMNELYAKAPARRAGEQLAPVVRPPASLGAPTSNTPASNTPAGNAPGATPATPPSRAVR